MSKVEDYRAQLRELDDWEPFLLTESHLPGPRANLELIEAAAEEGRAAQFHRWLLNDKEYLAACGAVGLGRVLGEGDATALAELRAAAADPRWRVREGVALGLQKLGKRDMAGLIREMDDWSKGNRFEQRAAAAALCEPPLLRDPSVVPPILAILDAITASLLDESDRKSDGFVALKKALGYCWSVAVAAAPEAGKPAMEQWLGSSDKDIAWIMRENLKKDRLRRMDAAWVARLAGSAVNE